MSEQTQNTNTMVIALAVIAVLLAAIVGVIIWQQSSAIPPVTATTTPAPTTGAPAGMGGTTATGSNAEPTEFDTKTATKVPEGMSPEDMLRAYHEDIIAGKFAEAYAMLPLDKQKSYGDATAYEQQVAAYGITSYELGDQKEDGDTVTIAATQVTPQMPISYDWTFKQVDGQWYVVSRTMGGGQ